VFRTVAAVCGLTLALAAPLTLESFWLQTALFAMAAAIGAIGLTLLVGVAGQLSLGHAFFVAVGAYGYALLSGGSGWCAVQPDRRAAARHLSRPGLAGPGLPGPAHRAERDRGHGRVQRP
jgi:ABC-type branched-subunit amino acid transport system permease subunit